MKKINISRLQPRFSEILIRYMEDHQMNQQQLAKFVGIQRSHLNALLNGSPDRPLTAYYLWKFILKGIVKVAQIKDDADVNGREKDFWEMASEAQNTSTIKTLTALRRLGFPVDEHLKILLAGLTKE